MEQVKVMYPGPSVPADIGRELAHFPRLDVTLHPGENTVPSGAAEVLLSTGIVVSMPEQPTAPPAARSKTKGPKEHEG